MSASKLIRRTSVTLTGIGTAAIVAALAIGMTGWPPATAYAETAPVPNQATSLALSAETTYSAASVTTLSATTAQVAVQLMPDAKAKSLTSIPVAQLMTPKRKAHVKRAKRVKRIRWSSSRVSWYGPGFYGNTMAGGGKLQRSSMVVAHRSLPFGTRIQFRYKGRTAIAVVRDRGPYVSGRTFDLGPGTAKKLRFGGVGTVQYRIIGRR